MKKTIRFIPLITIVLCLAALSACKKSSTKVPLSPADITFAKSQLVLHSDSLTAKWQEMVKDDDDKLASMKRLMEEVSYTNDYDEQQFDSLMAAIAAINKERYDWKSMTNSDIIDQYDVESDALLAKVLNVAQSHPQFENYPLMQELITEIQESDNRVFFHRVVYDDLAKNYNSFIVTNSEALGQAGLAETPEQRPLFQLSE